ncbi:DUF2845 domain-containing protein [Methylobacterium currus]|uniref:DUF2845 domain-containing protein n=1 Tax=Methylobacterium currus TaxID=2051553 RepID=A0A2R4WTE9_9HYPH|nr:DUF2845 domain-containing protein [Methylobacterium currus]
MALLAFAAFGFFLHHLSKVRARKRRRDDLLTKYGDEAIVDRIVAAKMWQGMTAEMLRDSWGEPDDIGSDVYKTRTTETWKYGRTGRNRYMNRVIVEGGVVVGHKQR